MAPRKKKSDAEMAPYAEPSFIEEDVLMDPVEEEDRFGDSLEDAVIGEYEAGIPESEEEVEEIEEEIDQMIEEFSGRDYVPASFVSDMNTNVEAVQFAFQTDPISVEKETPEEAEEEPESFWDKIKGLFE